LEPGHVRLAAFRADDARRFHIELGLSDQGEAAPARLRQQGQQLGRVGGDADLLPVQSDDQMVVRDGRAKGG
jgi:hypothetical protein